MQDSPGAPATEARGHAEPQSDVNPIIVNAKAAGCLSTGTMNDWLSASGIPLACTTAPVVLLLPLPPLRNPKSHLPNPPPPGPKGKMMPQFEGGEHTAIGDSAELYFSADQPGVPAFQHPLTLPNGLQLTYGQLLALGGDFYGIPDAPISDGASPADRVTRFTNAFNTLATAQAAVNEAPQILAVMQQEIQAVNAAINAGQSPVAAYEALGDTLSGKWNVITGGGWLVSPWVPFGRYMKLASTNWDHFGAHAVLAYKAGHTAALTQAMVARTSRQQSDLELAYAMNAFSDHFLSDLFSSGHLRTPRKELHDTRSPVDLANYLSRYMHNEDCKWGLKVSNQNNNQWRAFGDGRYFETNDLANKNLVDLAVQMSVDDIFMTFLNGVVPDPSQYGALAYIPNLAVVSDQTQAQANGNGSPLFYWDGTVVWRRTDINNLNDYTWISNWWVTTTMALFKNYNPPPPQGFAQPPTTSPTISGWHGTQSVPPNWVQGAQVRYAVSLLNAQYESTMGPWSAFSTVGAAQAFANLTGVPVGPAGTVARRIYREFINQPPLYVGQIADNTTTTFTDIAP